MTGWATVSWHTSVCGHTKKYFDAQNGGYWGGSGVVVKNPPYKNVGVIGVLIFRYAMTINLVIYWILIALTSFG